jgi:hypothetical protein
LAKSFCHVFFPKSFCGVFELLLLRNAQKRHKKCFFAPLIRSGRRRGGGGLLASPSDGENPTRATRWCLPLLPVLVRRTPLCFGRGPPHARRAPQTTEPRSHARNLFLVPSVTQYTEAGNSLPRPGF